MELTEHNNKREQNRSCLGRISFYFLLSILTTALSLNTFAQSVCVANIDNGKTDVCLGSGQITFSNAVASGANIEWLTSGDGTFNDSSLINPTYTPGPNDLANGYVFIYLDVYNDDPVNPCSELPMVTLNLGSMHATATPAAQTICSGSAISRILFSGALSGTVYNWTRDNTTTISGTTGTSGSSLTDIRGNLINSTTAPVNVTFTITPTASTCSGTPITATVLVNPKPTAVRTPTSQTICSGAAITPIELTSSLSGTTFSWTRNKTDSVTGIAASGSGNIMGALTNTNTVAVTVTFTITPTSPNGCIGTAVTATVLVNPTPNVIVATPPSQTICSGATITSIVSSGGVSGTTYSWTRNNTTSATGIAASGTGSISGALTNTTTAPVYVTFTITASSSGCTNRATVLVNPTPNAVSTPSSQTICSGSTITPIALSSGVSGTSLSWTRNNTASVTGIASSGSGSITGALTNTTASPVTVTFTITPTANGCTGTAITASVLVNPSPGAAVATPSLQTVCSGAAITSIVLSGGVSGTTYNWSRNNTAAVSGIATSGTGNIIGALTNTSTAPVSVVFTITPTANGCAGTSTTATVTVNPRPKSAISGSQSICTGTAASNISIALTGSAPWTFTYSNGTTPVTVNSTTTNPYTFTPPAVPATYTVTSLSDARCSAQAADMTGSATLSQLNYTITASSGLNGTISPNGATSVNCGASQIYNITPNAGVNIQDVLIDGVSHGAIATYTFSNVTASHTISASFSTGSSFTISASSDANGTITPAGTVGVTSGSNQTFSIAANSCYQVSNVLVDGVSVGAVSTYTFSNITASHTISASFSPLSYIITASAGVNGSISPNSATSINCGQDQTFTITPNSCYQVANVLVDGVSVGAVSTYTFSNVKAAHTISASFSPLTYTITASAGTNGSISPNGAASVNCGGSQTFSIAANSCYQIADVLVDGISQGAITTYTFANVTSTHTISASFSPLSYAITASAGSNGTISPNGTTSVNCGSSQTFDVVPNAGFSVQDVLVDGISQGAIGTYTFSNVTSTHTISATFTLGSFTITASAGSNGIISPTGSVSVTGGSSQTYSIAANSCYQIASVLVDGISVGAVSSYTFSNVTAAHTISASFSPLTYTINASAGTNGTISPNGATLVNCGANQAYTIKPKTKFFIQDVVIDGISKGAIASYTFSNVTAPHTISATFSSTKSALTITASAGANGTITPSGKVNVISGSNQTFTIVANSCYKIADVQVDGVSKGAIATYTFTNITVSHTISASFSPLTYIITASAGTNGSISPNGGSSVNCGASQTYNITPDAGFNIQDVLVDGVSQGAVATYTFNNVTATHSISATFSSGAGGITITASAGANGTITPSGGVAVTSGANQTFSIVANSCYQVANVLVDGVSVGAVSTYTFSNVSAAHTISASFSPVTYTITASAGTNGTITPNGATTINCGANQTYNITPNSCYQIANVLVDGVSVGAVSTYTFSNVSAAHTISASFSPVTYTITASAGTNGTITPNGATTLNCGANQTYNITPNGCYQVANVLVDGVSVGAVSSYTFSNVSAAHTISASFSPVTFTITASAGTNGIITPNGATTVNCGANQTFSITPNAGFGIQNVLVDGVSQGAITTFSFTNITSAHTISATFIAVAGCTPPTLSTSVTNVLCKDASTGAINLTLTDGTAPFTYAWTGPNGFTASTKDIAGLIAGSYSVIVTATGGCTTSGTAIVTQPAAALTATASAASLSCGALTTTLTVTASGGTGTRLYSLNGGAFQTGNTFTVNADGSAYTVIVEDANLCTTTTNSVTVAPAPTTPPATPTGIDGPTYGLCGGGTFTYTVHPVAGATGYFWSVPTGFTVVSGQLTGQVQISVPATFTGSPGIWASPRNACGSGTGYRLAVNAVLSYPSSSLSGPSTVNPGQTNVQYSLPFTAGATYNWLVPTGSSITGGQGTSIATVTFGTTSGNVSATITNACGTGPSVSKAVTIAAAKTTSANQLITTKPTSENQTVITEASFNVYPNPTQSNVTVVFSSAKKGSKFEVVVSNIIGETLLSRSGMTITGKNMLQFNLGKFTNGMYLIKLVTEDNIQTQRLIKGQ